VGCASSSAQHGPWVALETRQFSVPLVEGTTLVEVRDEQAGWVERVWVESDGRAATGGIPVEEHHPGLEPSLDEARAAYFRSEVGDGVSPEAPPLERAAALRDWVARRAYAREPGKRRRAGRRSRRAEPLQSMDGREVLADIDRGGKFNCQSVATVLHDAARAFGLQARRCDLSIRHLSPYEGHSIVEVWAEGPGWVVMDPMFNCHFEVDGEPAGALELHNAVVARRFSAVRLVREPNAAGPDPRAYATNPLLFYRNVYLILPGGRRLTRVDERTPPAPVTVPNLLQTESDEAFLVKDDPLGAVEVRRGSAHGRIAYQAVAGTLYVCVAEDVFRPADLQARTARGLDIAFTPESPPLDPDDPLLFAPGELATNGALADANGDGAPEGWTVKGAPTFTREAGGALAIEAGAKRCELVMRADLAPGTPVAAFARMRVERGRATLGLRNRREGDAVTVEPGPKALVGTRVLATRRPRISIRVTLDPGSRCVLEQVSLRRALKLGDWG
jgi:hypothetical protein